MMRKKLKTGLQSESLIHSHKNLEAEKTDNCKKFWPLKQSGLWFFPTFPVGLKSQLHVFSNLNSNCLNVLDLKNLQEQVKKYSVSKIALTFDSLNKLFQ